MSSKVSELSAIAAASVALTDLLNLIDVSAGISGSKKIEIQELMSALKLLGFDADKVDGKHASELLQTDWFTLAYNANISIDFATLTGIREITVTGNISFTATNMVRGRRLSIYLLADSVDRNLTFPSGGSLWDWFSDVPTVLHANKNGLLDLTCRGTTDSSIIATFVEKP